MNVRTRPAPLVRVAAALLLALVAAACSAGSGVPAASTIGPLATSGTPAPPATASVQALPTATESETQPAPAPVDPAAAALAGTYRCLSRALYYDKGGGGTDTCALLAPLSLGADGRWGWETSSGTWRVRPVTAADWAGWGIQPYGGVTQVLVLDGLGQGPIEPDGGFVWVIYRDASAPGTVWLKWGRAQ